MIQRRTSRTIAALTVLGTVTLGTVASASGTEPDSTSDHLVATATVRNVNGAALGTVRFFSDRGKLDVSGRLSGLTPGFHGFHVHAVGICDPRFTDPTGAVVPFGSAGPHLNPGGSGHGAHVGDLPLLYVAADGRTMTATENDKITAALLFDTDGSAIIVHALPDNYANIPTRYSSAAGASGPDAATLATGDSGGRVACGVFTRG